MENNNPQNLQPEESKNRWAEKKQEKELGYRRQVRKRLLVRFLKYGIAIAVIVVLILFATRWVKNQSPKGPDYSKEYPTQSRDHIPVGSAHPAYNSDPPTGGWHYANPADPGFYSTELADEQVVHNLEHGHIWISYRPTLTPAIITELKKFSDYNVIITPRAKNSMDIALVAWGRLDTFNLQGGAVDLQRIQDFILRYASKGPEQVSVSSHLAK